MQERVQEGETIATYASCVSYVVVGMRMRTCESARKCMWYGIAAPLYRFRVAVTGAKVQTPPFTADGAVLPSWLR